MRSHKNKIARNVDFYDVLNSYVNATPGVRSLRNRCLMPGLFAEHLERWMLHFPSNQVYIIVGQHFCMHDRAPSDWNDKPDELVKKWNEMKSVSKSVSKQPLKWSHSTVVLVVVLPLKHKMFFNFPPDINS